ncbi:MAG: phosphatidylglycerophosphatase A [Oligoflexia bacterium]|nr:phosphatidylglycerophosphatase A [Oligoflexia bacterium]
MLRKCSAFLGDAIATFFYVGKIPFAPGTFGSLAALPFSYYLWKLPSSWATILCVALFFIGVWAAQQVIDKTKTEDHSSIVMDEVIGIFIVTSLATHWWDYVIAFILFRIFDIWKPWPIRWIDKRWKGGLGAMMDDVFAAAYAFLIFFLLKYFQISDHYFLS